MMLMGTSLLHFLPLIFPSFIFWKKSPDTCRPRSGPEFSINIVNGPMMWWRNRRRGAVVGFHQWHGYCTQILKSKMLLIYKGDKSVRFLMIFKTVLPEFLPFLSKFVCHHLKNIGLIRFLHVSLREKLRNVQWTNYAAHRNVTSCCSCNLPIFDFYNYT